MTAKQEAIAAAWRANPEVTAVRIVEILKAGGTDVSKSSVDNMKKALNMVATGQRGRKKKADAPISHPVPASGEPENASTETPRPAIVFTAPSALPEWIDGANAPITTTASVTPVAPVVPVAPVKARKPKKKASKAKPKSNEATFKNCTIAGSQLPTLAGPTPPESFDGVVRRYADQCVAYLSMAKSGAAGSKACVADLKRAFAVLGISF